MDNPEQLTHDEIETAFRRSIQTYSGSRNRWAERIQRGLSDAELADALKFEMGIAGGSSGCGDICAAYQGAGLKIWASRKSCWPLGKPILEGNRTVAFAREYYRIPNPADNQMNLF